jgi:acyl-CoA thioester hydrolase
MEPITRTLEVRWADLDPNFHVLHSKYYDYGAYCRMSVLTAIGITPEWMTNRQTGLILLREECAFRREIRFGDSLEVTLTVTYKRNDFSRFTFQHDIIKNGQVLAARIVAELAWMDLVQRKLTAPPLEMVQVLHDLPYVPGETTANG